MFHVLLCCMSDAGVCPMTVKLTETGEQDRDSLVDEYEQRGGIPLHDFR